jgi:hypothetical protein
MQTLLLPKPPHMLQALAVDGWPMLRYRLSICPPAALIAIPAPCWPTCTLIVQRTIMTRSDLNKADIYGADFTNALIDKTQQMVSLAGQRH